MARIKVKDKRKQMVSTGVDYTDEYMKREPIWRVNAVIHDGNWYDLKKWARVAKVKPDVVEAWIEENKDILVLSNDSDYPSYRVEHDEIVRWYEAEGLGTDDMIIPRNFPPKLWGGMTESEAFRDAPRRRTGVITITIDDDEVMERVQRCTRGVATMYPDKKNRHKLYSLSATVIKRALIQEFSSDEIALMNMKSRTMLMLRELIDFDASWLDGAFTFYLQYAETVIPAVAKETMEIYIPDRSERESQVITWVIEAMKKFDETKGVPFSGYLDAVLSRWPYNLPVDVLGKELSDYQRIKRRTIDQMKIDRGVDHEDFDDREIAELMELSYEKYLELSSENETWMRVRNATALTWDETANEKAGVSVVDEVTADVNHDVLSDITRATILATLSTSDYDSGFAIIDKISANDIENPFSDEISEEFLEVFKVELSVI